jgi:hypothetical protein
MSRFGLGFAIRKLELAILISQQVEQGVDRMLATTDREAGQFASVEPEMPAGSRAGDVQLTTLGLIGQ